MGLSATAARAEAFVGGGIGLTWMAPTVAQDYMDSWHRDNYGAGRNCEVLDCNTPPTESGALKLFGGYRFNPYFAVEGFAANFSGFGGSADDGVSVSAISSIDISTLGVAAIGMYPFSSRMSLMGKIGLHNWSAKGNVDLVDSELPGSLTASFDVSGAGQMAGVGLYMEAGDNIAARFEYELFGVKPTGNELMIGFFSVSVMYRF